MPTTDDDIEERASLDGRVAFAIAAFALMAGIIALLDRIGIAERIIGRLGSALVLIGLATIGVLVASMRVSRFYAGGRAVPPPYAGLALAALAIGLAVPFAPPVAGKTSLSALLAGFGGGILLAALVTGPLLRKTGAFSLPDLLATRYPPLILRLGTVIVVGAIAALVALAGFENAANFLTLATGIEPRVAMVIVGLVLLAVTVPGGMSGVVWAAAAAAGILFVGLALPMAMLTISSTALAVPVIGDPLLFQKALLRIIEWQAEASSPQQSGDWVLIAAMIVGIGTLAPLLGPAVSSPDRTTARRAGFVGAAWIIAIAVVAAAAMATAALAVDVHLIGLHPESLPDFAYAAGHNGRLRLCGKAISDVASAKAACGQVLGAAGTLRAQDVAASGPFLLLGLAPLTGLSLGFAGLIGAGLVAISLVLAAAGFQALATTLAHDAFYRVRDARALTSRRLAMTRLALIALIAASGFALAFHPVDPRAMIGLAIAFSVAAIAPLVALALWPRANGVDATIALLMGLATAEGVIVTSAATPSIERLAASALLACAVGFVAGFAASWFHRNNAATQGDAFVHDMLRSRGDAVRPDKGA